MGRVNRDGVKRHVAITACASRTASKTLQFLLGHACVGLLSVSADLCLAGPANSLQSLGENGVAVVVSGVHPVSIHRGQVLDLEFDEGRGQLRRVTELVGESI